MANNFLDNLKKAVETGEFNSEAAKKIIEINKLADIKLNQAASTSTDPTKALENSLDERLNKAGVKTVTAEEAQELNSQYEQRMEAIRLQDTINQQVATLIDIEDMVKASIDDMFSYVTEIEDVFSKEFAEIRTCVDGNYPEKLKPYLMMFDKVNQVRTVYEPTRLEYNPKQ